jgi:hypothetical protein
MVSGVHFSTRLRNLKHGETGTRSASKRVTYSAIYRALEVSRAKKPRSHGCLAFESRSLNVMGVPLRELDAVTLATLDQVRRKAEPRLEAALTRHGVSSPDQLPQELAEKIFWDTFIQVAVENFPEAQLDALKHGISAFQHHCFWPSFSRLKSEFEVGSDAFAFASGTDAAVVLAGFGLAIAPFDRKNPRLLGEPSNRIDEVIERFSNFKTAYVGYSPCDVPFYILITDCMQTIWPQIATRPELRQAKKLLERAGTDLPRGPLRSFTHGLILIPREPGDNISTVFLSNPRPHEGSIGLYAGWTVNGVRDGTPNNGFIPVPLRFLEAAIEDPQIPMWIWRPSGVRMVMN